MRLLAVFLCLGLSCTAIAEASAAELRVLATNAMHSALDRLKPEFTRATGHTLSVGYEGSAIVQQQIVRGDPFDVAILFAPNIAATERAERTDPASRTAIARSGLGMVVRAGLPVPDIGSVDAFKATLLAARSIAFNTQGASGVHFAGVIERLGIAEQVRAKARTIPTGRTADLVTRGETEMAIQQMSELIDVPGTTLVGPLPAEVNLVSQVVAAVAVRTEAPEAARAFIAFLRSPEAIAMLKASGMEPL